MKTNLKLLGLPVLLAATLSVVGCRTSGEGGRTAGRMLDDENITHRVETALQDAPTYKFDGVRVSTYGGKVQLSGWVSSQDQKNAAEQIARNTQGNLQVINNISVYENANQVQSAEQPQTQPATGGTRDNP
ncbi:MAG TPA: BON domain-containing protein [Verrucomicrobiae bacterium]|nr:BON domain-containing protein [Verrucomicrobiae bacterium]